MSGETSLAAECGGIITFCGVTIRQDKARLRKPPETMCLWGLYWFEWLKRTHFTDIIISINLDLEVIGVIVYHETTEEEKYAVCEWKYDGKYSIYNTSSYEEQIAAKRGFANPENHFFSFCDGKKLIGYVNLIEEESEVFFGIGVNPDYCDQGYGQKITKMACELSHQLYSGKPLYLEVRTWNTRAVKCYEKAGFHIDGEPIRRTTLIGEGIFYRMVAD